jgi:ribonuclease III
MMKFLGKLTSSIRQKGKAARTRETRPKKDSEFEKRIGYNFKDPELMTQALTHPSFHEHKRQKPNNQRLEFLGDSILGAILSENLYNLYPDVDEGILSKKKAVLAQGSTLAELARNLKLGSYLRMGASEKKNKGNQRESTLEDGLEALIGAIFLDGGMSAAKDRVLAWLEEFNAQLDHNQTKFNPKGQLQEFVQANRPNDKIRYKLVKESGPPHNKTFRMTVSIGKKEFGEGLGRSKKEAEETAAEEALLLLGKDEGDFTHGDSSKT